MKAIFVINMARDADRWTAMRAHLVDDLGLSDSEFERFEAVDGRKFSEEVTAACRAFCTPTMRGCALSHMRLWKLGIERDLDAMLVLEDDARLAPNWREALDRAIAAVGNDTWDLIQLGTIAPRWNHNEPVGSPGVVRPKIFAGAHAYAISRRGMRHYVCAIRRAAFHVDIHMGATSRRGAVFLVDPPVATQAGMGENSTQFADGARAWPAALNGLLAAISPKNQATPPTVRSAPPLNYWATVPIAQIPVFGGIAINAWTLIFAILAVVAKKSGLAWLALLPVALAGLQPVATYSKDMAFCIFLFYGIYFLI